MGTAVDASRPLLEAIVRAHRRFAAHDAERAFAGLLEDLLALTESASGFFGEIVEGTDREPLLRKLAACGAGSDATWQRLAADAIRTGASCVANAPAGDPADALPLRAFLAIPLHSDGRLLGIVGVADRPGGYDLAMADALEPLLATCANWIDAQRDAEARSQAERARWREAEADALVLDISHQLLEASGAGIDTAITECLGRLAVFVGASAASLHELSRDARSIILSHGWFASEVPRVLRDNALLSAPLDLDALPWALQHPEPGMRVLTRPSDLPPEAARGRAAMAELDFQATAWIASKASEKWAAIALAWIGRPAAVAESDLDRFTILADLFGATLRRRRDEASLRRHATTEAMLLDFSSRFLEFAPERVDAEITRALGDLAGYLGAERATFSFGIEGGATIERTHEWGASITRDPDASAQFRRRYASGAIPYLVRAVASGKAALVRDLSNPPAGAEELLAAAAYGVRSEAWIPARAGGRVVGAIGLCWFEAQASIEQADLVPFSVAADLFAAVLRRRRAILALRRRAEIDALVLDISHRLVDLPAARVDAAIDDALTRLAVFANADRVVLHVLSGDGSRLIRTHAVGTAVLDRIDGMETTAELPLDLVDWTLDRTIGIGLVTREDFPDGSVIRTMMSEFGVSSWGPLVARVGDVPVGLIMLAWMESEPSVDRADLEALAVVANLLNAVVRRKEAETALRESEERFRVMANTAPLIVWTSDAHGRFTFVNERGQRLAGFPRAGETAETWLTRIHPADLDAVRAALDAAVPRQGSFEFECRFADEPGQWRTLVSAGVPRFDADGVLLGSVGTSYDITDRKRLEEDLRHAQKMEAVGRLAGGIAHDFNNILTAVFGHVEGAQLAVQQDQTPSCELEGIEAAANRAASLTHQLLAFSRRQIIEPRVVDVNELVRGVETLLRRLLGAHVLLEVDLASGAGSVRVDPGQIEQMLINLAANARDAMPEGGRLAIRTDRVPATMAPVAGSDAEPLAWIRIEVRDTGSGMDEKTLTLAFEPFFTTKEIGRGTGLGLATCYGIVKQNQGHISVESHPGSGTRFEILLPAVESLAAVGAGRVAPERATGGSETLLLVEDEPTVRELIARALERAGYRVLVAPDGEHARAVAEHTEHPIDMLVTDLVMPRESGSSVAAWARERWPGIRVLFISGYSAASPPGVDSGEAGIAFLAKPFAPQDLIRRVRELLDA